jgi:hypothetical protein
MASPDELAAAVATDQLEADLRCGYEAFCVACAQALLTGQGVHVAWDGTITLTTSPLIVWGDPPG